MKRGWFGLLPLVVVAGCANKVVDLTPGSTHEGIEFSAVPLKKTYKQGETVTIRFQVKNTSKVEVPLLVDWRDPNFGMSITRTLKSGSTIYELDPINRDIPKDSAVYLTNISFMPMPAGIEGLIHAESIREATPKGGKKGPLPPGEYTFLAEYQVKTPYDGTYELGGKREKLPIDEGEARGFLNKAPRGLWRAECTFTVTNEMAPPPGRAPRGGRPTGN